MKNANILLSHGGGGEEMNELINGLIFKYFDNEILKDCNDSAILKMDENLAFSTDSYVVTPIFFNGGDIGKIAMCGTINDLCMVGANPLYMSVSFIIEEGFGFVEFEKILASMAKIAKENSIKIVCGDTKVVPKGKCDKIFINTSGIGKILHKTETKNIKQGSKILLSGDVARHGSVIIAARDEISLKSDLKSDCKSLKDVVLKLFENNIYPQAMRDATRGGLSAVLNEWAKFNKIEICVKEENIRIQNEVMGICELLGFEPYDLANEGTFVLAVDEKDEEKALEILKAFDDNASSIGEVSTNNEGRVMIENPYGVKRFLEYPKGELLPRIC